MIRERARLEVELEMLVREELMGRFREEIPETRYEEILEQVVQKSLSPWEAVRILMNGRLN